MAPISKPPPGPERFVGYQPSRFEIGIMVSIIVLGLAMFLALGVVLIVRSV